MMIETGLHFFVLFVCFFVVVVEKSALIYKVKHKDMD